MPSVEGLRENRTDEGVHVDWGVRAGDRRLQREALEAEGPFFTSKSPLNRGEKGHPPPDLCLLLSFLSVAAMSTSPHELNLFLMLPHHFLLHAKSLPGPTLRAPPKPEAGFRPLPSQVYI